MHGRRGDSSDLEQIKVRAKHNLISLAITAFAHYEYKKYFQPIHLILDGNDLLCARSQGTILEAPWLTD